MFGNMVARDSVMRAANQTAASAKEMGEQLEDWAKDGYEAVRERPLLWGAASLGIGALIGGLYALWQREANRETQPNGTTMPARSRTKPAMRMQKANGRANGHGRKRKRTRKPRIVREPAISE